MEDWNSEATDAGNVPSVLSPQPPWSLGSMIEWESPQKPAARCQRRPSRIAKPKAHMKTLPALACHNCRIKKVKCQLEDGSCKRCVKFALVCSVPVDDERRQPCSKKVIRDLQEQIRDLKSALNAVQGSSRGHTNERDLPPPSTLLSSCGGHQSPKIVDTPSISVLDHSQLSNPLSMLARLCGGGQWQLNRDAAGQLRCFGPTSSLHVTESVSSSILNWCNIDATESSQWQTLIPSELQRELLDLYWTYQHPVLQVLHKQAFLDGMMNRQTPYFSELLLCCIFACAARMSNRPEVRGLVFLADDAGDDAVPFLAKTVTALLEVELRRPGLTTVQSLLLLSVIDCARSNDTKGWLYAGDACRLAYDLGLHRDFRYLGSTLLSPYDLEIRQRVFWACFVFDRLWGLYLGRPHFIRLRDVTVPRLNLSQTDMDLDRQMAAAWANLLEIVGRISDILNGTDWAPNQIIELDTELRDWVSSLPPSLIYQPNSPPTVHVLHMQYCSAVILLHRPAACFGTTSSNTAVVASGVDQEARSTCVASACQTADILQDYQIHHGSSSTMSGVALHTIGTAATTLIANIVESRGGGNGKAGSHVEGQILCLKQCMRSLGQLEKSYFVTRRVRKIILLVLRLLNLDLAQGQQLALRPVPPLSISPASEMESQEKDGPMQMLLPHSTTNDDWSDLPMEIWDCPETTSPLMVEDFLFPTATQFDFLPSYESCYSRA